MRYTYRYRSFFWPALLVLVGIVALLVNTGQIPVERLGQLIDLWPLILIVIGIELILRRTVHGVAGDIAAALIVILAIVGAVAYVTVTPNPSQSHAMDWSADLGNIDEGSLEINVGAATIAITSDASVGSNLYTAHIEYSGPRPEVVLDRASGSLRISQSSSSGLYFQTRRFNLQLALNPSIPWKIHENSGAATEHINVARLTGLTIDTGASRDDITLGQPSAPVPVVVNGGALTVTIHRPAGVPTTVAVSGGAVTLNVDGNVQHAIGHLTFAPPNPGAEASYSIRVDGGACNVTVDTAAPSG